MPHLTSTYEDEIGSKDRIMDYRELVLLSCSRNLESGSGSSSRTEETASTLLRSVRKPESVYSIQHFLRSRPDWARGMDPWTGIGTFCGDALRALSFEAGIGLIPACLIELGSGEFRERQTFGFFLLLRLHHCDKDWNWIFFMYQLGSIWCFHLIHAS